MRTLINIDRPMRRESMEEPEGAVMDRGERREEARVEGRGRQGCVDVEIGDGARDTVGSRTREYVWGSRTGTEVAIWEGIVPVDAATGATHCIMCLRIRDDVDDIARR